MNTHKDMYHPYPPHPSDNLWDAYVRSAPGGISLQEYAKTLATPAAVEGVRYDALQWLKGFIRCTKRKLPLEYTLAYNDQLQGWASESDWYSGISVSSLPAGGGGDLIFRGPVTVSVVSSSGHRWQAFFHDVYFGSCSSTGCSLTEAVHRLTGGLKARAHALLSTPTHLLEDDELEEKSQIIAFIDPLNSDIGLPYSDHRLIVGKIMGDVFHPLSADFKPIALSSGVAEGYRDGDECIASVKTFRDGTPKGEFPITELRLA